MGFQSQQKRPSIEGRFFILATPMMATRQAWQHRHLCPPERRQGCLYRCIQVGLTGEIATYDDADHTKQMHSRCHPDVGIYGTRLFERLFGLDGNALNHRVVAFISLTLDALISLVSLCLRAKELSDIGVHSLYPSIHPCLDGLDPGVEFFTADSVHGLCVTTFAQYVGGLILLEFPGFQSDPLPWVSDTFSGAPISWRCELHQP